MSELLKFETTKDGQTIAALLCFDGWYQGDVNRIAQWSLYGVAISGKPLATIDRARIEAWLREERWSAINSAFVGTGKS